jgi:DGQHR domain-containing protein
MLTQSFVLRPSGGARRITTIFGSYPKGGRMLATRITQKEGIFYFIAYNAGDLLEKVRFTSRYYFEGEEIAQTKITEHDEVAQFIAGIERSEKGFQRVLNRQKIKQIVNFYETVVAQPMIPGTVLLFTDETLRFQKIEGSESIGHLSEPKGKYLVIDGQHRLAGLHFFHEKHPDQSLQVEVPCLLFDGRSADFATEMFVIINSTHTRINRSHLVDLYEKVSWESPEKKFAAKVVNLLYSESDSPLQYKVNRLGGRSKQEKWILQSEVFNELLKLITAHKRWIESHLDMKADRCYALVRDYLKGVKDVMGEVWGQNDRYMFTRDVTLKALIRVLNDLIVDRKLISAWEEQRSHHPFAELVKPWATLTKDFRADGFYERFPAKGQLERVRKIHQRLLDAIVE